MAASGPEVSPRTLERRAQKYRLKLTREDYVSLCKFLESYNVAASGAPRTDITAILEHIGELNAAQILALVTSWARANHREAGTFIATMPDGEAKNSAVQAFATTVAKIDPDAAEQWALTLPPGPRRDTTLQQIRANVSPEGPVDPAR